MEKTKTQFHLLKTLRFLPLFVVQFIGAFNDNAYRFALAMLITYTLVSNIQYAQLLVNIAGGVFMLGLFLFSMPAGQLGDKYSRVKIARIVKTAEIFFFLLGAFSFYIGNIPLMILVLFLVAAESSFFIPIKYSALPYLLTKKDLLGGNALIEAGTFVAVMSGTIIGSMLGATVNGALIISAVLIITSIIGAICTFFIPAIPVAEPNLKINWNIFSEIVPLYARTMKNKLVFTIILAIAWFWLLGFAISLQFPAVSKGIIHGDESIVVLFLLMFTVGIAVGSLLCNYFLKGKINLRYVPLGILAMTAFILDLSWTAWQYQPLSVGGLTSIGQFLTEFQGIRITLDLFLLAFFGGFYTVPLYATMQIASDASSLARTISCSNASNALFMLFAAITIAGLVGIGLTSIHLLFILGVISGLISLYFWVKLPKLQKQYLSNVSQSDAEDN